MTIPGATRFDKICHSIFGEFVPHNDSASGIACGKCGQELLTYYCEERLYLVECRCCGIKALALAKSQKEACYKTFAREEATDECSGEGTIR